MRLFLPSFALLVATALTEAVLLRRILLHPAGGGDPAGAAYRELLLWALLPLVAFAAVMAFLARRPASHRRVPWVLLGVTCCVGPLLAWLAFQQYGHGTPGLLLVAFAVQCSAAALAGVQVFFFR